MCRYILALLFLPVVLMLSGCDWGAPLSKESELQVQGKATELVWAKSLDAALAQARQEGRGVLMDFTSASCGYCKQMERDYYTDPEVIRRMMKAIPVKISGDEPENATVMKKYDVHAFPALVFVDGNGNEYGRIGGCPPTKGEFIKALDSNLK